MWNLTIRLHLAPRIRINGTVPPCHRIFS
jgi:hypothetical protein